MTTFAEVIESELNDALENKNKEAVRRLSFMISEKLNRIEEVEKRQLQNKSDIQILAETMKRGFDQVDQRIEALQKEMDKRFEAMQGQMDKRFEQVDKRFEDMNKRFTHQTWFIVTLIAGINIAIALIKGM
jgi:wyosine [tRNA(Phe)-imidazoG37] synthetase (radical SAM superfamily)